MRWTRYFVATAILAGLFALYAGTDTRAQEPTPTPAAATASPTPWGSWGCKRWNPIGFQEDRLCVFLPAIENPPSPTPVPTVTPSPTPYTTAAERKLLDACAEAGHGVLRPAISAAGFERLEAVKDPTGSFAWAWNSARNRNTGQEYEYISSTEATAHSGKSSMAIDGIAYQAEPASTLLTSFDLLSFRSGQNGVVSSIEMRRKVIARKIGFWIWVERVVGSSFRDTLTVELRDCTENFGDRCRQAYRVGDPTTFQLRNYPSNQWHYVEAFDKPDSLWPYSTLASVYFKVDVSGDGVRVYFDDVDLSLCGPELRRWGGLGHELEKQEGSPAAARGFSRRTIGAR